jgi:hypothetical protein
VLAELIDEYGRPDAFAWHGGRTGSSNFAAMALHIIGQQIQQPVATFASYGSDPPLHDRVRPAEPEPGPVGVYAPSAPPSSGVAAGAPCALRRAASAAAASESPDQRWLHNSRLRFAQEFVRSTTRRS